MKHLKRFNEALDKSGNRALFRAFKAELKEFCEDNLAYLLDEVAEVNVSDSSDWDEYSTVVEDDVKLTISLYRHPSTWDEIKNHIIPFLIRLDKLNYELHTFGKLNQYDVRIESSEPVSFHKDKISDLIKDKISVESQALIYKITIYFKGYQEKSFISKIKSYFK